MVKTQPYNAMSRGSRPQAEPFSASCSANPAVHPSKVGKCVLRRNPELKIQKIYEVQEKYEADSC